MATTMFESHIAETTGRLGTPTPVHDVPVRGTLQRIPWRPRGGRVLLTAVAFALGIVTGGCASIVGDQDADTKFLVKPQTSGSFYGWSEITISDDTSQVSRATLQFVTLSRLDDPTSGDLTFIQALTGRAGQGSAETLVVEKIGMPEGDHSVPLDIMYHDDLKPLFPDGHTIHVDWNGSANTLGLPADGIWVNVHIRVHVE